MSIPNLSIPTPQDPIQRQTNTEQIEPARPEELRIAPLPERQGQTLPQRRGHLPAPRERRGGRGSVPGGAGGGEGRLGVLAKPKGNQ